MKSITLQQIKQMIRQQIVNVLNIKQITQTGAGEAYESPYAFGKKATSPILNRWG